MASPFFGGPERQVLGLARALRPKTETVFLSFTEGGQSHDFMSRAAEAGFATVDLENNWPHMRRCKQEIASKLVELNVDVVCCNGYKPDILGVAAARSIGVPSISIAHGWTSATTKVRINEWLDKRSMRWFDRVVGVSKEQSRRVIASGVPESKVVTIHNGVDPSEMGSANDADRSTLESLFDQRPETIFLSAGRLSPEKGFDVLIDAMQRVVAKCPQAGLVIFGGGPLESDLRRQISFCGLQRSVVLGGFRDDLNQLIPQSDGFVLSSRTEGLPVILLETMAAGVASVVTPVGGVGELVRDRVEGIHAPVESSGRLADSIIEMAQDSSLRRAMGQASRNRIDDGFTHGQQAQKFQSLFEQLAIEVTCGRRWPGSRF